MCFCLRNHNHFFVCYLCKMTHRRKSKPNPNTFCYVRGKYALPAHRQNISHKMKIAYNCYLGCKVGDQNKKRALHICCNSCNTQLLRWAVGKQKKLPFAVPMIWREPTDHVTDCYFCLTLCLPWGPMDPKIEFTYLEFNRCSKYEVDIP